MTHREGKGNCFQDVAFLPTQASRYTMIEVMTLTPLDVVKLLSGKRGHAPSKRLTSDKYSFLDH